MLAAADFLIVPLVSVRGKATLDAVRSILRRRGSERPTLIISSTPNDLVALRWDDLGLSADHELLGPQPRKLDAHVVPVGRDRPQRERELEFAVEGLRGQSVELDRLVRLAETAWWAVRQRVTIDAREEPEIARFRRSLEHARTQLETDASLLAAADRMLSVAQQDTQVAAERRAAIAEATFAGPTHGTTLVLTRNRHAAAVLNAALAQEINVSIQDLEGAGLRVSAIFDDLKPYPVDHVVVCGYFGPSTLDSLFASGASLAHLVLDPIEARAAWYGAREMKKYLRAIGAVEAERGLEAISSLLERHLIPFADLVPIDLKYHAGMDDGGSAELEPGTPVARSGRSRAILGLIDGSLLEVPLTARLDVIERRGPGRVTVKSPQEIVPGDEILLVAEDSQSAFSERLIEALDKGGLRDLAEQRAFWFAVQDAALLSSGLSVRAVERRLRAKGVAVSYAAIRSWVTQRSDDDRTTPARWPIFKAFAEAIEVKLPNDVLRNVFRSIRRLRALHRLAGRRLVRAIRAAYLGRLDATTLSRIQREWGLSARELVQSTRLVQVDSVSLPQRGIDGTV